jgi:hypothetical protein
MASSLARALLTCALGTSLLVLSPHVAPGQHFSGCLTTATNATLLVPDDVTSTLGAAGDALSAGDEIAVFTSDGQCAGSGSWQDASLAIAVAGTNSQESGGYENDELLQLQVWDASAGAQYEAAVTYASCDGSNPLCQTDGRYSADAFYALASLSAEGDPAPGDDPPGDDGGTVEPVAIAGVNASKEQHPNVAANTLDGDLSTRWSAYGLGVYATYELSAETTVEEVHMAWYRGDQRNYDFEIAVSTDGSNWTTVRNGSSGGSTLGLEAYAFSPTSARFVRITGYGNSANNWNAVTEVAVLGQTEVPSDDSPALPEIVAANASEEQDPNVAENTLDGDFSTRWSAYGHGVHVTYELSAETTLDEVGIAWYRGDRRQADFEIALSTDGSNWTTVHDGLSSGTTMLSEYYSFPSTPARFVRVTGNGNSENSWTSMTRFELGGAQDGSSTMFASKRALSIEQPIEEVLTDILTLDANFPNPFRQSTTIQYALPEGAYVTLEVFDMLGRRVAQLVNEEQRAGEHRVQVRADNWSSGTYLYRLRVDGETRTGRMTVVR